MKIKHHSYCGDEFKYLLRFGCFIIFASETLVYFVLPENLHTSLHLLFCFVFAC